MNLVRQLIYTKNNTTPTTSVAPPATELAPVWRIGELQHAFLWRMTRDVAESYQRMLRNRRNEPQAYITQTNRQ